MTADGFPSMRARALLKVLYGLGYEVVRTTGSHRHLRCPGRPPLVLSFHTGAEIAPGLVRSILTKQVGLTTEEALEVIKGA